MLTSASAEQASPGSVAPAGWPADAKVIRADGKTGVSTSAPDAGPLAVGWVPCTISPLRTVELAAPFSGVIESVDVKPGQHVEAGDVIARFDSDVARSELAMAELRARSTKALEIAESRASGLEKRFNRLMAASSSRAVPASDLENAEAEAAAARGEVRREEEVIQLAKLQADHARIMVEKSTVRSPVAGSIGEVLIDPGESPAQSPIATIYVTSPMKIEAYLPTSAVASFTKSESFTAKIAGRTYPVTFDHRANVADVSSNTLSIFFTIESDDVLPGLDCRVTASGKAAMAVEN